MIRKPLGRTGVYIPEIGLGTWKYRGGIEPLRVGISLGANMIDTAEMYGTEDIVGRAIDGIRDDVFLATKVSPQHFHYDDLIKSAETSLKKLNTNVIDLYQLHWPNPGIPIRETMKPSKMGEDQIHWSEQFFSETNGRSKRSTFFKRDRVKSGGIQPC
jgi:diketogulonate reductase-like aldo/keto reductase